ncbi:hypothetical protein [Chitinophaga sp. CB10]|uniref:hypothetical protein n=1 Tax=Chitinophaga sp. CB10 TaxID=1891659 RepID=UPI0025B828F5|nr:hypothetical protein [Chitinophaga sp. CB10]
MGKVKSKHLNGYTLHHSLQEMRSEPVQEIMGKMPPWLIRQGIVLLCIVILALFAGAWFFTYPEITVAQVTILTMEQEGGAASTTQLPSAGNASTARTSSSKTTPATDTAGQRTGAATHIPRVNTSSTGDATPNEAHPTGTTTTAKIPARDAWRIHNGQEVLIRVTGFPAERFGLLRGKVAGLSASPTDTVLTVDVALDKGLETTSGQQLPPLARLDGTAEITTAKTSLLRRLLGGVVTGQLQ